MIASTLLESYARILTYPAGESLDVVRSSLKDIAAERPAARASVDGLLDFIERRDTTELEEVFTSTFDSNAERALEIGWHVHGENYARGVFMARMRSLLREHGIEESSELPDHLSHVLLVLAKAKPELSAALARGVVVQALEKIVQGFPNEASKEENPYRGVIVGLKSLLEEEDFDE